MVNQSLSLAKESIQIVKLNIKDLMRHEEVSQSRLNRLARKIEEDGMQRRPVVVHRVGEGFLMLDGHHRAGALEKLGYPSILATEIGFYLTDFVSVRSWRSNGFYDKTTIIQRALDGDLYPPHTTRHIVSFDGGQWKSFRHNDVLEPKRNISLKKLERPSKTPAPPMQLIGTQGTLFVFMPVVPPQVSPIYSLA